MTDDALSWRVAFLPGTVPVGAKRRSIGPPPLAGLAATRGGLGSARRAGLGRAGQGQGVSAPWGHAGMIAVLVVARRGGHNLVNMWR